MLKRLLFAVLLAISFACHATVYSLPWGPKPQFVDANGAPMSGGTLGTFIASSSTPQVTYTDSTGGSSNPTTITLNTRGETPNEVWLASGVSYKFVLKDSAGSTVWTVDGVSGVNDVSAQLGLEWVASGLTPTYVSPTSFTLVGDQTTTLHVGRRLKTSNTGGTIYSTITASVFGAATTITVENDSGTLDAGLSSVSYGIISQANSSDPAFTDQRPVTVNNTDRTKRVRISASGLTTGKTRVLTVLDQDFTLSPFARGYMSGFTYANNGGDSIDIAAGAAADSTNAYWLVGSALTKNITAAWAVGTAAGCLDTGAVGNSDYYIWVIVRIDTQVVDYLCSLSSTAPTMPASYTFKRLIGWFKRVGGTNVAFHTYETEGGGLEFSWDAPTQDINLSNTLTTARRTDAVKVPLNFSVTAELAIYLQDAGAGSIVWISCPDHTDAAPSAGVNATLNTLTAADLGARVIFVRTSSAGLIAARATIATVDTYQVGTQSFRWARRN